MYSSAFYTVCTASGILSCGFTHMTVTLLDLVKCNMQVYFSSLSRFVSLRFFLVNFLNFFFFWFSFGLCCFALDPWLFVFALVINYNYFTSFVLLRFYFNLLYFTIGWLWCVRTLGGFRFLFRLVCLKLLGLRERSGSAIFALFLLFLRLINLY